MCMYVYICISIYLASLLAKPLRWQGTRQGGTLSGQAPGRASLSADPPGGRPECPPGE